MLAAKINQTNIYELTKSQTLSPRHRHHHRRPVFRIAGIGMYSVRKVVVELVEIDRQVAEVNQSAVRCFCLDRKQTLDM